MDSKNYDEIRNLTILFFLDRLVDKGQSRTLHDLSCQFGTKGFTKEMRQIAGGSQSGLRKFLSQYPSLFTIDGEHVSITCYNNGNSSGCSGGGGSGGGGSGSGGSGGVGSSRDYAREAVDYFHDKLDQYGAVEVPIRSLLGHRSQATPEIRHISGQHIREFRDFLLKYSDTFVVHDDYVVLRKHWDSICEGGSNAGGTLGRHEPSPPPPPGVELTPLDQQLIEHVLDFCRSVVESGRGAAVDIEQLFENLSSRFQRESYTRLVKSPQDLSVLLKMYSDSFLVQGGTVALVPNRPTTQRTARPPTTLNGSSSLDNGVAAAGNHQQQSSTPPTPTSPSSASSSSRPSANPPPALQSFKQRLMSHLMKAVADNNAMEQRVYQSGAAPAAGNPTQQQQHPAHSTGVATAVVSAYDVAQMNNKLLKATKIVTRIKDCLAIATHIRVSSEAPVISLDAEGVNLGPSGPMTLLQIGTTDGQVFIFDLIACKEMVREGGLKEILESPHITKVVHDCRNDSAALFHQFQVSLQNVFDTQAAHAVLQQQQTGKPVHKVKNISLNNLCRTYGGPVNPKKEQMKKIYRRDQKFWSRRPLSDDMILYAGYDIWALVPTIYNAMSALLEGGPANPLFRQLCAEQTDTFIRIDDVKHNKKMRKIETEVAELKRKLAAASGKAVVLSNREIRLLRHVELTDEEKEKLDGSYKVARKLERLQNRGTAANINGGGSGSGGPGSRSNADSSEASPEFDEDDDDLYENDDDLDDDLEEEEEDDEDELDFGASDGSSLSPMCSQSGEHRATNGKRTSSPSIEDSIRMVEQFLASERFEGLGCLLADEPGFSGMMTASDSCSCLCHHDSPPASTPAELESKPKMVDAGCQTLSTGDVVITKVHFEDKANTNKGGPAAAAATSTSTGTSGTATPPQGSVTTSTSTSSLREDSRKC